MIVIFDLDGTLANIDHRLPYITNRPKKWDLFHSTVHLDEPKPAIIELYKRFYKADDTIIICSGRNDIARSATEAWLAKHELFYTELFMRPDDQRGSDVEVKKAMLDIIRVKYGEPTLAIDDRQRVVDFWRSEGITCLQCDQWEETSTLEKLKKAFTEALNKEIHLNDHRHVLNDIINEVFTAARSK